MPKLWNATIDAHRRAVREAILDTTAALVAHYGLRAVTMSRIASETGIGRATLYKYFSDVDEILHAWHEREISRHLEQLVAVRDKTGDARDRLEAVVETYALIRHQTHGHHDHELAALVHRGDHVAGAEQQVRAIIRELLAEGVARGTVRDDVTPDELASYTVHALGAASSLPSRSAVKRLVAVTLAGIRPS